MARGLYPDDAEMMLNHFGEVIEVNGVQTYGKGLVSVEVEQRLTGGIQAMINVPVTRMRAINGKVPLTVCKGGIGLTLIGVDAVRREYRVDSRDNGVGDGMWDDFILILGTTEQSA